MASKVEQKWEQFVQESETPVQQPVESEADSQKFKDLHCFHEDEASESDKWEDMPASNKSKSEAQEPSQASVVELEEIKERSHEATPPKLPTPVKMAAEPMRMQEVSPYAE